MLGYGGGSKKTRERNEIRGEKSESHYRALARMARARAPAFNPLNAILVYASAARQEKAPRILHMGPVCVCVCVCLKSRIFSLRAVLFRVFQALGFPVISDSWASNFSFGHFSMAAILAEDNTKMCRDFTMAVCVVVNCHCNL